MALAFDSNGYLTPYNTIAVKWDEIVQTFGLTARLREILAAYEDFLTTLSKLLPVSHRQWIDGSFSSQQPEPGNIDVIIFIPHTHFAGVSSELKQLKNKVADLVNCYFVETFPPDNAKLDWYHFLRTDRRKRPKGTLELWFDYEDK